MYLLVYKLHTTNATRIQSILLVGYAAYQKVHLLPDFVREAAHCLMVCCTAVLGGHTQACPDGHYQRVWYNSCKPLSCINNMAKSFNLLLSLNKC
jgi:hypothetical protein